MIEEMKQKDAWKRTGNALEQMALKMKSKMCNTPAEKRELDGQIMLIRNAAQLLIKGEDGTEKPKTEEALRKPFESVSDVLDCLYDDIQKAFNDGIFKIDVHDVAKLYERLRKADKLMQWKYGEAVDDCGHFLNFIRELDEYVQLMRRSGDAVRMALVQYLERDLRLFKYHRIAISGLPGVVRREMNGMLEAIAEADAPTIADVDAATKAGQEALLRALKGEPTESATKPEEEE